MTQPSVSATPECTICGNPGSIMSIMSFTDYSQQKICPLCAPIFLRATADSIQQMLRDQGINIGAVSPVPPSGDSAQMAATCTCGCDRDSHELYDGQWMECTVCDSKQCEQFTPAAAAGRQDDNPATTTQDTII